jgi:hypothetical protein
MFYTHPVTLEAVPVRGSRRQFFENCTSSEVAVSKEVGFENAEKQ